MHGRGLFQGAGAGLQDAGPGAGSRRGQSAPEGPGGGGPAVRGIRGAAVPAQAGERARAAAPAGLLPPVSHDHGGRAPYGGTRRVPRPHCRPPDPHPSASVLLFPNPRSPDSYFPPSLAEEGSEVGRYGWAAFVLLVRRVCGACPWGLCRVSIGFVLLVSACP